MSFELSKSSKEKLSTCSEPLRDLVEAVARYYPLQVIEGHRNKERQDEAFEKGFSKLEYPNSKHNSFPSTAVDIMPLINGKILWADKEQTYHFAGFVMGMAAALGIKIRWGGDFNSNLNFKDQSFIDNPHYELIKD